MEKKVICSCVVDCRESRLLRRWEEQGVRTPGIATFHIAATPAALVPFQNAVASCVPKDVIEIHNLALLSPGPF
jgi:hypothetical protein